MSALRFTYIALTTVPVTVQAGTLAVMLYRKMQREVPIFVAYTAFVVATSLLSAYFNYLGTYKQYFYSAWISDAGAIILGYAVITEVFASVVKPYPGIQKLAKVAFTIAGVVLVSVSSAMAISGVPDETSRLIHGLITCEISLRIVQAGLLIFLLVFAHVLRLTWRHYVLGIALGFGIFAMVNIAVYLVRAHIGDHPETEYLFRMILGSGYAVAIFVWLSYVLAPEPQPLPVTMIQGNELAKWDAALVRILQR